MQAITGTLKNGAVILDQPTDWPEGCRVRVEAAIGEADEDDPEVIRQWIADFDAIPAWEMTEAEEAEWQAARQAMKNYTVGKMKQRKSEG